MLPTKPNLPLHPIGLETYHALGPVMSAQTPEQLKDVLKENSRRRLGNKLLGVTGIKPMSTIHDNILFLKQLKITIGDFSLEGIQSLSPTWLRPRTFIRELDRLNGPKVWETIVKQSPRYRQGRRGKLPTPKDFSPVDGVTWKEVQKNVYTDFYNISRGNAAFLSRAVVSLALGAALEPELAHVVRKTTNPFSRAALEVAKLYTHSATSPEELVQRLQDVYGDYAYNLFSQNDREIFQSNNPNGILRCPMRFDPTERYMQALGLLFKDEDFVKRFKKQITFGRIARRKDASPHSPLF